MAPTPADRPPRRVPTLGLLREILALLLIVAGVATVGYISWQYAHDLTYALIGAVAIVTGLALARGR